MVRLSLDPTLWQSRIPVFAAGKMCETVQSDSNADRRDLASMGSSGAYEKERSANEAEAPHADVTQAGFARARTLCLKRYSFDARELSKCRRADSSVPSRTPQDPDRHPRLSTRSLRAAACRSGRPTLVWRPLARARHCWRSPSGEWRASVRRTRCPPHLRRERCGDGERRRVTRLRPACVDRGEEAGRRLRARGAQRDRGNRRIRSRRAVCPARIRDSHGRRETRRPRHHRIAVRGVDERSAFSVPSCDGCSAG